MTRNIEKYDSIFGEVVCVTPSTVYLHAEGLEDMTVKAHNCYAHRGDRVLLSIQNIRENTVYASIDSILYDDIYAA